MNNAMLLRAVAGLLVAVGVALTACAQDFPTKPMRLIVPFTPGGPADVIARPLADGLQTVLAQRVIVDYRPGAGAIVGMQSLFSAPADGHTLLIGGNGLVLSKWLYKNLPYDLLRDLRGVICLVTSPYLVLVPPSFPGATVNDLIRMAKAEPGKLNFASAGPGTMSHIAAVLFNGMAGIQITHVPYKGAGGHALPAVMAGEVDVFFDNVFSAQSYVKGGRLRALGVTSLVRVEQFPSLPTVDEQGVKGYQSAAWFGIVAPKGVPDPVVARLNEALNKVLQTPVVRERYASIGATPIGGTSQAFQKLMEDDLEAVGKVIRSAGISLD